MAVEFTPEQRNALQLARQKKALADQAQQNFDQKRNQVATLQRQLIALEPELLRLKTEADQARQSFLDLVSAGIPPPA